MTIIKTGLQVDRNYRGAELKDLFYTTNGIDRMQCYDLVTYTNLGIRPPPVKMTDETSNIAGSLTVGGVYKARFEYWNDNKQIPSAFSPESSNITCQSNGGIRVDVPTDANIDAQVTHIRAYLTADGANIYRYDGQKAYTGTAIEYDFTIAESARVTVMGELNEGGSANVDMHGIPPTSLCLLAHQSRMWYFGTAIYETGTVTATNASADVVGVGTSFTDGMVGMFFQIKGVSRVYIIESVTDATNLVLTENYGGTTATGTAYAIYGEDSILFYTYIGLTGILYPESVPQGAVQYWLPVSKDDGQPGIGLGLVRTAGQDIFIIAKESSMYILSGDRPATYDPIPLSATIGGYHRTMANTETGELIFAGKQGAYVTNGRSTPTSLTEGVIGNIWTGESDPPWYINKERFKYMHGVYLKPRYYLWVASSDSSVEDKCLVYNTTKTDQGGVVGWEGWYNVKATCSGIVRDADGKPWVYFGDSNGFPCYFDPDTTNDGAGSSTAETRRGTATAGASTTLTDTGAQFSITGDGLKGVKIKILSGTGADQERVISSNTSTVITVSSAWDTNPDNTSVYSIGYLDSYRTTGWLDFGSLLDKWIDKIKAVFKVVSTAYSFYIKHYTNFSTTQTGSTKYIDLSKTSGFHKTRLADNRACHHQIKVGLCDTDRPFELRELELEFGTFGREREEKEAES